MIRAIAIITLQTLFFGCINLKTVNHYSNNALKATQKFEEIPYTFLQHCIDRCEMSAIDSFKIYREIKCPCDQYKRADSVTQLVYRALRGYFDGLTRLSNNQLTNYQIDRLKKAEQRRIPEWFDYRAVSGLSREMQEKLGHVTPQTLGQASRIPGVTPAAVSLINVYIEIQAKRREQAAAI